jgi:ubiquinone/menaquinone biosynthesis C-methylase UbiE
MYNLLGEHFDKVYSSSDGFDGALQKLLPANLKDQRVASLQSTSFLTVDGLQRLLDNCQKAKARLGTFRPSLRMLDVGCGRGRLGRHLAQAIGAILVGMDFSETAIHLAIEESSMSAEFLLADFNNIPFRTSCFEIVLAIDCLHLTADPLHTMTELRRVLVRGGMLISSAYKIGASFSNERPIDWWQSCVSEAGFSRQGWSDVTAEWKREMTAKHRNRWNNRARLIHVFGRRALLECSVSQQMLGETGYAGFIDTNARWEFVATAS